VNGKCQFVTRYENAIYAEWHFVSPDGTRDLDYAQAQAAFPTLKVLNGYTKDLTLDSIPEGLNGWRVYCRFTNNAGSVKSGSALITVLGAGGVPATVPAAVPSSAPAVVTGNLPVITKNPTDETVNVNGKCQFVTRYENAIYAEWHFVSPDGKQDLDYVQAQAAFPTLKVLYGYTKDLTLESIPETLNGWRVYCRFTNNAGSVKSGTALITVRGTGAASPTVTTAPTQTRGFEGRWVAQNVSQCQITFSYAGEGSVYADIVWVSSAQQHTCWRMTANAYRSDIMTYSDGHCWVETYTDANTALISAESYGGTGSFYLQEGKLHWVNEQTNQNLVFIPG
ncbi:MAG: hypothetical protein IKO83_09165, partial [Oscillospiraceae bacterium]|nr:hypothetical protein [Oscillospiraceae bacterium]